MRHLRWGLGISVHFFTDVIKKMFVIAQSELESGRVAVSPVVLPRGLGLTERGRRRRQFDHLNKSVVDPVPLTLVHPGRRTRGRIPCQVDNLGLVLHFGFMSKSGSSFSTEHDLNPEARGGAWRVYSACLVSTPRVSCILRVSLPRLLLI